MPETIKLTEQEEQMLDGALDVAVQLAASEHEQHKALGQIIAGVCAIINKRLPEELDYEPDNAKSWR